ncbi:sugar ABC transporter substrate-binding protein [Paenibacillus frigoriresistens]|uniref:ABC transporter substrate-binding protein n=1 Tax=Paenibacillus alginolyticus TaxID=59839 RepID=UPI0015669CFB|nr:sugar ABC transporter substrate-binding protein [Paenibacillus frigoriresistens]NRF93762.1 sugar ABC transporter substrate-binding protein [Paenibacillus frigoriresistens]
MKKLRAISAVVFCSLLTAACSDGGNTTGTGSKDSVSGSASSTTAQGKTGQVVTLKFMGWEASPLETQSVKNGLEQFMKQHPNIKVDYQPVPNTQYAQKLLTMLAGNAAPDVFFLGATEYRAFQKRNVLLDLTGQFKKEMSLDDFVPSSAQIMNVDGKIFGVSSCIVSPVLYYNKAVFDKAKIPYPPSDPAKAWTWDEFRDVAKKLTIKDGDKVTQYGAFGFENFYMTTSEILSNGGRLFNDNYTKMNINTPEVKQVMQSVLDLRMRDGVSPTAKTLESIGMKANQMLQTGKVAMVADGSWALQELATMGFPIGVAALPKLKDAKTHGQAHVHSASAKTAHPQEAWELLKYLSSEEYQISNIQQGLWMPNRKSLYTEEGVKKWYNDKVHPAGFKELIPYFANAEAYPFPMITQNKVNDIITEETDKLWYAGQSVDDTLKNIETRSNVELTK